MSGQQSQLKAQVDELLTPVSSMYIPDGCIADSLLPTVKFSRYSGKLGAYGNSHIRIENSVKAGKGKYRQVEPITRTTQNFSIEGHGLEGTVSKYDYANVMDPFDAEKDETIGLTSMLLVEKEYALSSVLGDTAVLTQNVTLSGSSQFSDYTNSDPVARIATAKSVIKAGCGAIVNTMVIPYAVAEVLRYHPQLLDLLGFKFAKPGGLTDEDLAKAFNIPKVFVPSASYNSAKEGQADVLADIWGKNLILAVIPDSAQKYQISLGYDIRLDDGQPRKVYKNPIINPPGSTSILVEDEYDMLLSNVAAGYLIKNAVA